jgi:hypothetical protein
LGTGILILEQYAQDTTHTLKLEYTAEQLLDIKLYCGTQLKFNYIDECVGISMTP